MEIHKIHQGHKIAPFLGGALDTEDETEADLRLPQAAPCSTRLRQRQSVCAELALPVPMKPSSGDPPFAQGEASQSVKPGGKGTI